MKYRVAYIRIMTEASKTRFERQKTAEALMLVGELAAEKAAALERRSKASPKERSPTTLP